jgi:acyl-CoA synthetase (AMP-forming)/AMP-acid ligase II
VLLGAAPVLPPLLRRATAALPGVEFLAVYGMTEILPVAIATAAEKLAHRGPGDLVGAPLPGVRARTDDAGRLVVAGANLARGYLGEPDLTEHTTGDLATLSDDGAIVLGGRATDMIIRGRTNIYPGLYEPAISALPGVAQAVLVGVPDAIGDERVVLVLVAADGTPPGLTGRVWAALPAMLDASALPDDVVELDEVPVTGRTRKTDRAALRDRLARRPAGGRDRQDGDMPATGGAHVPLAPITRSGPGGDASGEDRPDGGGSRGGAEGTACGSR